MENKVLALVNGREITEKEISEIERRFPEDRKKYFAGEEGKKRLLDEVVSFELIYTDAVDSGLMEEEFYKEQIANAQKQILTQMAISKVFSEVAVAESEVERYYEANKKLFEDPEKVRAKHILVNTEEEAIRIKKEIEEGKTFEDAAKEYSSCPSKERGGDLGAFSKGQMVPEFEQVAFSQQVGEIGNPVKTQFGYHLIKVEDKIPAEPKPFEVVKDMIRKRLTEERQSMKYTWYIDQLKGKYKVEIK